MPQRSSSTSPKTPRLFRGQPTKLYFCSLILLDPKSALKLDEKSMRGLFGEIKGGESLLRGIERGTKLRRPISGTLRRGFRALFASNVASPLVNTILKALDGDARASKDLDGLGHWAMYRAGCAAALPDDISLTPLDHCIEVENASRGADDCLARNEYAEAAQCVVSTPELAIYFHKGALQSLASATNPTEALSARAAGLCEFLLGDVARLDVALFRSRGQEEIRYFGHLLGSDGEDECQPGAALVRWLKARTEATTLESLLDLDLGGRALDESTLKRWSGGREFPSEKSLVRFMQSIARSLSQAERDKFQADSYAQFFAARRLHKTLEIAQVFFTENSEASAVGERLLSGDSLGLWARQRYDFWLQHWRALASPS